MNTVNSSIEEQVAMFLQVVGHNCKLRLIELNFRRGLETISCYFYEVLYAIGELRGEMLWRPSLEVHPKIANSQRFNRYFKVPPMSMRIQYFLAIAILKELINFFC